MTSTRVLKEKIQSNLGLPEAMVIEADFANESKEEKADSVIIVKKDQEKDLNKELWISYRAALHAFCICITISANESTTTTAFLFLGKIPSEIFLNNILPFLVSETDLGTYGALTSVMREHKPVSMFFRGHLVNVHLKQLLQHIAYGEKTQAEKIIQSNPKLLLLSGPIVKDHAGREIQQTAYQMALAAGDVFVKFKNGEYQPGAQGEEMKEMIERYLIKLLGEEKGVTEIERQRKIVWPDGFEERFKQKQAEDKKAVREIFAEIGKVDRNADEARLLTECGEALEKFKTHLEPKGIITTKTPGHHFDPQILVEAYGLYDANYANFGNNWNSPKNLFAWQKVIGLIQRYLTACDAIIILSRMVRNSNVV